VLHVLGGHANLVEMRMVLFFWAVAEALLTPQWDVASSIVAFPGDSWWRVVDD
jgi:hypothetical protein